MPVYEYHPDELARLSVIRRANGLSFREVEERFLVARDRAERARSAPEEPRQPTELGIATCQRLEWARIVQVMTDQRMTVYTPDKDRRVSRREEQRVQRMAAEATWSERSDGGVEVVRHCVYRITAKATVPSAGEEAVVRHVFAASSSGAVEHARSMFGRPGGIYHNNEYVVTSVEQVLPEPGEFF
ncbi:hypothetical protein ACIQAD_36445 [Streptomyces sp. NPDC088551]|uniref:hypothetical protein n=1 Tax=Streptomyces sp. NPDC088551 TaxID=3365863 RepID=UPI00380D28B9